MQHNRNMLLYKLPPVEFRREEAVKTKNKTEKKPGCDQAGCFNRDTKILELVLYDNIHRKSLILINYKNIIQFTAVAIFIAMLILL